VNRLTENDGLSNLQNKIAGKKYKVGGGYLTCSDQFSTLSEYSYSHIRQLRCIRPYLDSKTASVSATSNVGLHSRLD